ncbi:hypothetical protein CAPTEDRAFT_68136, partial [Capitella teleta]
CPSDAWMRRGSYCYLPGCQHGNLTQARDECASHNARLASIEDEEELRFIGWVIVSVANNPESDCGTVDVMYVGLSSSDNQQTWDWNDDTPSDYTNWESNEPN